MKRILASISVLLFVCGAIPVFAQAGPLEIAGFSHRQDGFDHTFTIAIHNAKNENVSVNGRLIVLSVYDTSQPISLPIDNLVIGADGVSERVLRWSNAPLVGQVRGLIVLNAGPGLTTVDAFEFWVFPWRAAIILTVALIMILVLAIALMRIAGTLRRRRMPEGPGAKEDATLVSKEAVREKRPKPKKKRRRFPSGMTGYVAEFGDTVVTIASRFDVTWVDVVRANHMKPPYAVEVGREMLIPTHALHRPEETEKE